MPETIAENRNTTGISGRRPPRIRFYRSKDETHIAVQQKRRRNADHGDQPASAFVDVQSAWLTLLRSQRKHAIEPASPCRWWSATAPRCRAGNPARFPAPAPRANTRGTRSRTSPWRKRHGGVRYISKERSGCPRCNCSGMGATSRNASAVKQRQAIGWLHRLAPEKPAPVTPE